MKAGDLVAFIKFFDSDSGLIVNPVVCIVLNVTQSDLDRGLNADETGLHLFRGFWYGDDPLDIKCYGKIEGDIYSKILTVIGTHLDIPRLNFNL